MTPGERVTLIRQLAEVMVEDSYTHIDLILRQFGFPWQEGWGGNKYDYLIAMLEGGRDPDLLALHEHVFGFSGAPVKPAGPACWDGRSIGVFISHVSANKLFAAALKDALRRYGAEGFVAHQDIEPTKEWVDEIEAALSTCDVLVVLLSPGFKESNWTDQEVGYCHGRRILIISVRQGLDPYGFISRYQALNGNSKTAEEIAGELYKILVKNPKTAARMAEALVATFERSDSFAAAKYNVALLQDVQVWTPDLLRRIEQAPRDNDQIRHAWGVSGQVANLLRANGGAGSAIPATEAPTPFDEEAENLPF